MAGIFELAIPDATRSGFAHSIDVYRMSKCQADTFAGQTGSEHDKDRERLDRLLPMPSDYGHGPFNHAIEAVSQKIGQGQSLEKWSMENFQEDTRTKNTTG